MILIIIILRFREENLLLGMYVIYLYNTAFYITRMLFKCHNDKGYHSLYHKLKMSFFNLIVTLNCNNKEFDITS